MYKLEYLNPTGSFKDRGVSLSLYIAKDLDYRCVVEDSSGNTGLSTAAYAAHFGLRARIHVPQTSAPSKLTLIKGLGAELVIHPTRREAALAAERESEKCFYVAHAYSPIFIEGIKSIAREIREPLYPIVVPASSGTLLLAIYRGFKEAGKKVEIVTVQAAEAASLEQYITPKAKIGGPTSKLADALVYKDPPRIEEMARATDVLVVVGDKALLKALKRLWRSGFIVEPSSAAVEAAREALGLNQALLVLTGSGLKTPGAVEESEKHLNRVEA